MIFLFFFNDTATTEIYTLSLHDALPISLPQPSPAGPLPAAAARGAQGSGSGRQDRRRSDVPRCVRARSEEHTSELQSRQYLVCRLLLEKKKNSQSVEEYCRDVTS